MKVKSLIAAVILAGMLFACTQKTCPTYTKGQVKTVQQASQDS